MTATIEHEKNYAPVVIRIPELERAANSDRLYAFRVQGISVIVNDSWRERVGQLAVLFPAEAQISPGLASFANLYRHSELNADGETTGYLDDNGRVRAIRLRGNMSSGLILPLLEVTQYADWTEPLEEGMTFDTLNGKEVSRKYVIPEKGGQVSSAQAKLAKAFKRVDEKVFPAHIETDPWLRNLERVGEKDMLIVTQKLHGTSVRFGRVPVKIEHKWYERLAKKLGVRVREYEHDLIGGSRKVIKDPKSFTQNHFYDEDIWTKAAVDYGYWLPDGFIVYGELVGYTSHGAPLQKGFAYDALPGEMSLYVYRVARVDESGVLYDLTWDQVRRFAVDNGMATVPELWRGRKSEFVLDEFAEMNFRAWYDEVFDEAGLYQYPDRPVALSKGGTGLDEGIVIRVDGLDPVPDFYKYKNDSFFLHETKELDSGEASIEA